MLRVFLFLATNIGIMAMISIIFKLLGLDGVLDKNGVDLNLNALLVMSAVIGMSGSIFSLFISKWMAKRSMGVELIEQPSTEDEYWLYQTVEKLAQKAGIDMPEVGYFHNDSPNAFATGWNKNNALVAVSTGLLQTMTADEVEAVLAHEICHVSNGDMVTLALVQGVVNTFVVFFSRIIGHVVDRVILKNESGHGIGYFVASMAAQMVLGVLASIITMWFSRWREYHADAGAAKLSSPESMIAALRSLQGNKPEALPEDMAALGIAGFQGLFSTHPPLEDRIQALVEGRHL